jgi:predicted kinase
VEAGGLVVVSGIPGSGKTTLAIRLAEELHLPLLSKDTIKESLFDVLGTGDLAWSQTLGRASHVIMYRLARYAPSAVLESHFWRGKAEPELEALGRVGAQVWCRCPVEVAAERYRTRAISSERHPGHLPEHQAEEVTLSWRSTEPAPLELRCPLVEVDTSRPVDVREVAKAVRDARSE